MNNKPRLNQKRARNQFKAWITWRLNRHGAKLPHNPSYKDLQEAVERFLFKGQP